MSEIKLSKVSPEFRVNAICCGGGGALLQDSTSTARRMISGKAKADQIRATGVKHVSTACLSCHRQLTEFGNKDKITINLEFISIRF